MKERLLMGVIALLITSCFTRANAANIIESMSAELNRSFQELQKEKNPPYFISLTAYDNISYSISGSLGVIERCKVNKDKNMDIELRIGSNKIDNSHKIRGERFSFGGRGGSIELPIEDNDFVIKSIIWNAIDKEYKRSVEQYGKLKTNLAVKVKDEDSSADFSVEKPNVYSGTIPDFKVDTAVWSAKIKEYSGLFKGIKDLYSARVFLNAEMGIKYYVNTEGSKIVEANPMVRLFATAKTIADDGMTLPLFVSYSAFSVEGLPSDAQIKEDILRMIDNLKKLKTAPLAETYTGPAILSGRASGVFFHEIFGHRVEGHRQKDPNSSQTFKTFIGKKILPDFIDVAFDPTLKKVDGVDVMGYYVYDDEGVKGQRVQSVKNGIFEGFLMSRSPIENFPKSNGHGRKQQGYGVCTRQSNLVVSSTKAVSEAELKNLMIAECKKQGKEYGLYFVEIQGGFTFTNRTLPNSFNVQPLLVYKIYVDGRPDELVRGVDLIGTPLTTFSNVSAASDKIGIFNGVCGAESGGVPVSASSPSLMVSTIEVQKKDKSQAKPPILEDPNFDKNN